MVTTLDTAKTYGDHYLKMGWAFGRIGQEIIIDAGSRDMRQECIDLAAMCIALAQQVDNDTVECDNSVVYSPLRLVR